MKSISTLATTARDGGRLTFTDTATLARAVMLALLRASRGRLSVSTLSHTMGLLRMSAVTTTTEVL
jgi:hypothetical protein